MTALALTACVDRYALAWTPMDNDPNIEAWSQNEAVHMVDARVFRDPTLNVPVIQTDPDAPSPAGILFMVIAIVLGVVGAIARDT